MKRLLLIMSCALLCPMLNAAQEDTPVKQTRRHTTGAKKTGKKTTAKKTTKSTAGSKESATKRSHPTTAGKHTAKHKTAKAKTTTTGKKAHTTKKTTKPATNARTQKSTYSTKPKAQPASTTQQHAKRVYRKGGPHYKHFKHLNDATAQKLGTITAPVTQTISLNEPGRGYKNANHLTFTTPDGKQGHIVLDSHVLDAARAEQKGLHKLSHVGQKSVEVYAGTDAKGKGLALVGEYPLLNANLKGNQDLEVSVNPNGQVTLSGKNESGNFAPITEFSIHQ